jgi:hypothetical protein
VSERTVRGMVEDIQAEVRAGNLLPNRAADLLGMLTALLGNVNEEILVADADFAAELLRCMDSEGKANRARIVAETTPAYRRRQIARNTKELVTEMIASLKYIQRAAEAEMRFTPR